MISLGSDESRVLSVLVEKALTTPAQYPLTLNALVSGCNQKSNRHPVTCLDEDGVLAALDSLRGKELVREVLLSGSRVSKYRHNARETLGLDTSELILITELLLRGPQTAGELRGRASRMHRLESIEVVENLLAGLIDRDPPMVSRLAPAPGTRAATYMQLLSPDLHGVGRRAAPAATDDDATDLAARVDALEIRVEELGRALEQLGAAAPAHPVD